MNKNPLKFQMNMEVEGGSRFGISRTNESFKRMCMENHSIVARGAQIDNITQHNLLGRPYEEDDTNFVRGTWNFSKYGKRFKFTGTFRCLHFTDSSWLDGSLDRRNDTLLYSSQDILWFFRIDRKSGPHSHREFSQPLWRKRCQAYYPRHVKRGKGVRFYCSGGYRHGYNGPGGWDNTSHRNETIGSYDEKGHENTRDAKERGQERLKRCQGCCKKVFKNIYGLSVFCQDKGEKKQGREKGCANSQGDNERNKTGQNREQGSKGTFFKSSKRNFTITRTWPKTIRSNIILAQDRKSSTEQDRFTMEKHTTGDSKRENRQSCGIWKKMDCQLLSWRLCAACSPRECKDIRPALRDRIIRPSFRRFWREPKILRSRSWHVVRRKYISMSNGPGGENRNTTKRESESYGQPKRLQAIKKSSGRNRATDWTSKIAWSWQKPDEKRYWRSYKWSPVCPLIQFNSSYERYESTGSELKNNIRKFEKLLIEQRKFT